MFRKNIIRELVNVIDKFGDRPAFCIDETFYNYHYLAERISAIRARLRKIEDNLIGVVTNDDLDTYAAILASWFEGKGYVPINPTTPKERNVSILSQMRTTCVLDSGDECVEFDCAEVIKTNSLVCERVDLSMDNVSDEQFAYVLFTSGSAGVPKGVPITKFSLASFVDAVWDMGYDIRETDRCLQMFELTFDLSIFSFLVPLVRGACVYTIPKDKIKYSYIYQLMDEEELTVALMVPSILSYLRPYFDEIDCPKMRYSLFCGEALYENITNEWSKCVPNARIDNVYGPTEDTIFCTYYTYQREISNDSYNGVVSIGVDIKGCMSKILDSNGHFTKNGESGELCLGGKQLTNGYINNKYLNQTQFFEIEYDGKVERFYRSGDLAFYDEHGNIEYVGRKDHQVKIQGYRVELSEIEFHAKKAVNEKANLVAVAMDNGLNDTEIAIVIEGMEFDTAEMVKYMKDKMPSYMIPSIVRFMNVFPLSSSGKTDRKAIKESIIQR